MSAQHPGPVTADRAALRVGVRVAVRYRLPPGSGASLTDVLGVVTSVDESQVTVQSRNGPVTVAWRDVVAAKAVPPAPVRRGRPHHAVGTGDLERIMADGWPAVERAGLGDWLLRASSGFTRRANSVLPLGEPSLPLGRAIDYCEAWYAGRGIPAVFHLDLAAGAPSEEDPLGAELVVRRYVVDQPTLAMTAASADVAPLTDQCARVTADGALSLAWLEAYARQRSITPGVTEQVLTGSAGQLFLSTAAADGTVSALARMSAHPGWAGIHALWVDPAHRVQGLGHALVQSVAMLARRHRMRSIYLQVEESNEAAVAFYESIGFRTHHRYVYLVPGSA